MDSCAGAMNSLRKGLGLELDIRTSRNDDTNGAMTDGLREMQQEGVERNVVSDKGCPE